MFKIITILLLFLLGLFSLKPFFQQTILEKIKEKKRLDVVILNAPTVYYIGTNKAKGFEYELLSDFAKSIDVELNLTIVSTVKEALDLTEKGVGDITSASLSVNEERLKRFKFGPYYHSIYEELICNNNLKDRKVPKELNETIGLNILIGKDTSAETTLLKLKNRFKGFEFNTTATLSTENILDKVSKKEIDCTVVDSHIFRISQRYYPKLVRSVRLTDKINLGWLLRKGDNSLEEELFKWLNRYERSGKMAELNYFYFDYLNVFDYFETTVFQKRLEDRLPKYKQYFKKAGEKYKIPWTLLAAQAYQESHWDPKAKSPTGVEGMMMLTKDTAKELKVTNRLNVAQSIDGGAKYFDMMRKIFPKKVEEKNLWALSLAAYNIGIGHVYDAQKLAKQLDKNPYSWNDLKTVLPLLSQKKYYKNLKYGYARGSEPVRYVDSIQYYHEIIEQNQTKRVSLPTPPLKHLKEKNATEEREKINNREENATKK